jgi:3-keto-5-aminohexanoate cleavage enzyme
MAMIAMVMGGHVRVGLEDNIYLSRGVLARSNAELVEQVARIAKEFGRDLANPQETREVLNLYKKKSA